MTSRAVDTPTPPDPTDDPRLTPLYFINPNVREDAYNRGVMDAARALATADPSIPERPDPARDLAVAEEMFGHSGSIPERPADPLREAARKVVEWDGDPVPMGLALLIVELDAALALQSTPESRDE